MRIKHGKCMVILTGFPYNGALFGLVVYIVIPATGGSFVKIASDAQVRVNSCSDNSRLVLLSWVSMFLKKFNIRPPI